MTKVKRMDEHGLLQMNIWMIWPPPFLCKWSFAKRTVLRMTKIRGTEEHGLLQMTIWMIRPPLCSSVPLQMVICKEDFPPNDQNQRDGGAQIVANDHMNDPASSVLLRFFAKRTVFRMTNIFWSNRAEIRTRPAPSIEDPQYKISNGPTVQELTQSDR